MSLESMPNVIATAPGAILSPAGLALWLLSAVGVLPSVIGAFAALAAGLYYSCQWWEGETMKGMRRSWNTNRAAKKIAKLQAQQAMIIGELKQLGALQFAETSVNKGVETTHIESKPADASVPPKS